MNTSPRTHAGDVRGFHYSTQRRVMLKPWLLSQGGVYSWMKKFDFGGDSENSPFEAGRYLIGVVFMVKMFFSMFFLFL